MKSSYSKSEQFASSVDIFWFSSRSCSEQLLVIISSNSVVSEIQLSIFYSIISMSQFCSTGLDFIALEDLAVLVDPGTAIYSGASIYFLSLVVLDYVADLSFTTFLFAGGLAFDLIVFLPFYSFEGSNSAYRVKSCESDKPKLLP